MKKLNPIFKCPGGKSWAIEKIQSMAPKRYNGYIEPFVGGGSVFMNVAKGGVISDGNPDIVDAWQAIKHFPQLLMSHLSQMPIGKDAYLATRKRFNAKFNTDPVMRAAEFIYLNRCGYNGLIRYSKKGDFNVPFGRHDEIELFNEQDMLAASAHLQNFEIAPAQDFQQTLQLAKKGDWVFIDSPYDETFSEYTQAGFSRADQMRLAAAVHQLHTDGVKFLLTNSNTELIRALYASFKQEVVPTRYRIGAQVDSRKAPREELFVSNY